MTPFEKTMLRTVITIIAVAALISAALAYSFWTRCENVTQYGVTVCVTKDGWVIK